MNLRAHLQFECNGDKVKGYIEGDVEGRVDYSIDNPEQCVIIETVRRVTPLGYKVESYRGSYSEPDGFKYSLDINFEGLDYG